MDPVHLVVTTRVTCVSDSLLPPLALLLTISMLDKLPPRLLVLI